MKLNALLRRVILFPFLLPVFFVLHSCRYLFGGIPFVGAVEVLALYLAMTAAIYLIVRKLSRHGVGAGVETLLIMALFIYWSEIIRYINKLLHISNFIHLPVVFI